MKPQKSTQKQEITTIKLKKRTKERIDKLKVHDKESYDRILQRMLSILNLCRTDSDEAQDRLIEMERYTKKFKQISQGKSPEKPQQKQVQKVVRRKK